MTLFCISYDLNKAGQDYTALHEAIKALGTWWHCLDSTWLVKSNLSSLAIAKQLWAVMDANDKLLVTQASDAAWAGFTGDCESWLKSNA